MRIALAGVTGPVGREIVPRLLRSGHELVLLGRDPQRLERAFPGCICGDLEASPSLLKGCERLVNLAALNNDADGSLSEFMAVNEGMALNLAVLAESAGIAQYVYVSSVHALDETKSSNYAISKRAGREALLAFAAEREIEVLTIYLGGVANSHARGNLALLSRLPPFVRDGALHVLGSLRPVSTPDEIAGVLGNAALFGFDHDLVLTNDQSQNPFYRGTKRAIDLMAAIVLIPLLSWLFAIIYLVIKADSTGPAIFAQVRVGSHGREFTCYKFRTMHVATRQAATHLLDRSAVTRAGNFLRRWKLDELPQLLNVLRGDMALVGPRPCLPNQSELIEERDKRGVLAIRPGITGLAQINDVDMSDPQRLARIDARYIALRTLLLDARIMLKTAIGSGKGDRTSA